LVPVLLLVIYFVVWFLLTRYLPNGKGEKEKRLARKLLKQNRVEAAIGYLRKKGMERVAAQLLVQFGKAERAVALFEELGDYLAAGKTAVAAGLPGKAEELFQRAGDRQAAARQFEKSRQFDRALQLYLEADDVERVATLARYEVDDPVLLKIAADFLYDRGDKELALAIYGKGKYHKRAGRVLEELGRMGEAVSVYEEHGLLESAARVYSLQGEHRRAAYLLIKGGLVAKALDELLLDGDILTVARMYRRLGKPERVLDILERLDNRHPDFKQGMLMASALLTEDKRFPEAILCLDRLLKTLGYRQDMLEVVMRLADLQLHVGDISGTIRTLKGARRAGIDDDSIDEHLALLTQTSFGAMSEDAVLDEEALQEAVRTTSKLGFPASDRYTLVRKLTRGGHGVLYLVQDGQLKQEVVLKLLHSESLPSAVARKYFLREAKTASSLDHPNIVKVFDWGELQTRLYIAMEYVRGQNLLQLQEPVNPPLTFEQKLSICLQLCEALAHAHERSVIHRDVKMENVMLTPGGQLKLLDFGLAKAIDEDPERSLSIVGTPNYMSPEQLAGQFLDLRTDIYSLGVLMYRLFTGRLPFEDNGLDSPNQFVPPPDPREFDVDIPKEVVNPILRCLERNRENRPSTTGEVAAELRRLKLE